MEYCMKTFTKKSKKALLHSLPFAILLALCCMANAQTLDSLASLKSEEQAAQAQYAQTMKACGEKLAPAQCQRQAGLDFKQAKHSVKIKRDALNLRNRQEKQAQHTSNAQANYSPAVPKQLPQTKSAHAPLSKPVAIKPDKSSKEKLSQKSKPPKAVHRGGSLSTQPTPAQRAANAAATSQHQALAVARQQTSVDKVNKRLAKDAARRAAGHTVDKP
jgi:hypothetical protein